MIVSICTTEDGRKRVIDRIDSNCLSIENEVSEWAALLGIAEEDIFTEEFILVPSDYGTPGLPSTSFWIN